MSDLSLSPFGERRKSARGATVTVGVSLAVVIWLIGLLTAAINQARDVADLKAGKVDKAVYEVEKAQRFAHDSAIIGRLDRIACRQEHPATACPL